MDTRRPLVIFDIDGTIIKLVKKKNHEHPVVIGIKDACGIEVDLMSIDHVGMCDIAIVKTLLRKHGLDNEMIENNLAECKRKIIKEFEKHFNDNKYIVLPGVKELLSELKKRGAFIALGTGNFKEKAMFRMNMLGLGSYFKFGGFGDVCMDRECLLKTAMNEARKRSFSGDNIFAIGDTVRDVAAAKNTGIKIIAVATGKDSEDILWEAGSDYVLKDLSDTENVIKIIYG